MNRMPLTLRAIVSFFSILCICAVLTSGVGAQRKVAPSFKIGAITAKLFDEHTGAFSSDLLTAPASLLRNRRTGPGSENAMLIVVEINGQPGAYEANRKLWFTATDSRKALLKRQTDIEILSEQGKYFLAFWVYDVGCYPVTLTARIAGQSPSRVVKSIPFRCGD